MSCPSAGAPFFLDPSGKVVGEPGYAPGSSPKNCNALYGKYGTFDTQGQTCRQLTWNPENKVDCCLENISSTDPKYSVTCGSWCKNSKDCEHTVRDFCASNPNDHRCACIPDESGKKLQDSVKDLQGNKVPFVCISKACKLSTVKHAWNADAVGNCPGQTKCVISDNVFTVTDKMDVTIANKCNPNNKTEQSNNSIVVVTADPHYSNKTGGISPVHVDNGTWVVIAVVALVVVSCCSGVAVFFLAR